MIHTGKRLLTVLAVNGAAENGAPAALVSDKCRVISAAGCGEALDILRHGVKADAVLIDLSAPGAGDGDILERISDFSGIPPVVTGAEAAIMNGQIELLREIVRAGEHDRLTDLYNRKKFLSAARRLLDESPEERFAMVYADIENFRIYNALRGEREGDRLLRFAADGVRRAVRDAGPCVYARFGAHSFCICLRYDKAGIENLAERARREFLSFDPEYRLDMSVGVYAIENPGEGTELMAERAALAARECRGGYKPHIGIYSPEISAGLLREQQIINGTRRALNNREFEVYFQPVYDIAAGKPLFAEALVRWRHPQKGIMQPGDFTGALERGGFIGELDYYVWDEALSLLRGWIDGGLSPLPVSVNVSREDMRGGDISAVLPELLKRYNIPPGLLNLELTGSACMEGASAMERGVRELKDAGFKVFLDDFGSGYSSLGILKAIPVDAIKIDMSLLPSGEGGAREECILSAILEMAAGLGIPAVMEGVETRRQAELLGRVKCRFAQGGYYAKPMPAEEFAGFFGGGAP